jgi:hypothetical protein
MGRSNSLKRGLWTLDRVLYAIVGVPRGLMPSNKELFPLFRDHFYKKCLKGLLKGILSN